jgi:hypothetical protein
MGGDPDDVHAAVAVLDHDQDVEAAQEDGVDVGEVDREDRVGLRGQELAPGRSARTVVRPGDHAAARSAAKHQVNSIARGFGHPQCRVSYRLPLEGRIKSGPASSYGPPRSGVLRLVL